MRNALLKCALLLMFGLMSINVAAYDWVVTAHVTTIEPSNVGNPAGSPDVYFRIDQNAGYPGPGCAAGWWLYHSPLAFAGSGSTVVDNERQMANSKAMLSTLQIALALNRNVEIYGLNNIGTTCQITNIHLLNN